MQLDPATRSAANSLRAQIRRQAALASLPFKSIHGPTSTRIVTSPKTNLYISSTAIDWWWFDWNVTVNGASIRCGTGWPRSTVRLRYPQIKRRQRRRYDRGNQIRRVSGRPADTQINWQQRDFLKKNTRQVPPGGLVRMRSVQVPPGGLGQKGSTSWPETGTCQPERNHSTERSPPQQQLDRHFRQSTPSVGSRRQLARCTSGGIRSAGIGNPEFQRAAHSMNRIHRPWHSHLIRIKFKFYSIQINNK